MADPRTDAPIQLRIAGRIVSDPTLPPALQHKTRGTNGVVDPFLPTGYVRAVEAIDVSETARATTGAVEQHITSAGGEVIALELSDGTTIYTSASRLEEVVAQVAPDAVLPDGSVDLESLNIRGAAATRDILGVGRRIFSRVTRLAVGETADTIIAEARRKLLQLPGNKAGDFAELGVSWLGTKALMWAIESRLGRKPGLYRWIAAQGEPTDFLEAGDAKLAKEASEGPLLVFIHGTASSTVGSYSDLQNASVDYWRTLSTRYGDRIYAFEHRTMSESPIDNALQLAQSLPPRSRIHIVTHSRGGLVGDLLCLDGHSLADGTLAAEYSVDDVAVGDVPSKDRERVRAELDQAFADHRSQLQLLGAVLREKQFVVERYVRVAAPARGTRLASGNLDVFLSGLLTLVGLVPALAGQPIYSAFKRVVLEIVKNRTRPNLVPGIEAMLPESPMARVLAKAKVNDATEIAIIAGDIQGGGLLKRLGVLFTDHVFFNGGDNDLVVDSDSMYAGIARPGRARALFDQGTDVSHFRYFANDETRRALSRWLLETNLGNVTEFQIVGTSRSVDGVQRWEDRRQSRGVDRSRMPVVVVLPGIMGSHLWVERKNRVWFSFTDLALGGLGKITYDSKNVEAERVYDPSYGDLCVHLSATHRVETHAYDWRLPLDALADSLARHLRKLLDETRNPLTPIRILAHSMGGLVVRALAHKHTALFNELMERDGARFVMLGTPNRGAHTMVETLIGKSDNIRKLTYVDVRHSMQEVLDIVGGFRGALQLLPSPTMKDVRGNVIDYYADEPWNVFRSEIRDPWFGNGRVSMMSKQARDEGRWLWDQDEKHGTQLGKHSEKITYVHGVAPNTTFGFEKIRNRWKMLGTKRGDGTVPWDSGKIDGVTRYYFMPAEHGALADTQEYFPSLESLLSSDNPGRLIVNEPVSRSADDTPVSYEAGPPVYPTENELELELIGKRKRESSRPRAITTLKVQVRAGDLRDCAKPIVVGHYAQDAIAGAEALIDRAVVDGGLTVRHNLGLYAGAIGTATVVLKARNEAEILRGSYRGAVVAGLGKYDGTLSVNTLTESIRTAALRYLLHIHDATDDDERGETAGVPLATLLVGYNSSATLSIADSVTAILKGVIEANKKFRSLFKSRLHIDDLEIMELYVDTAISTGYALNRVAATLNAEQGAGYRIDAASEIVATDSMRHRLEDARAMSYWPRLHITAVTGQSIGPKLDVDDRATGSLQDVYMGQLISPEYLKFLYVGQRARAENVIKQRQPGLVDTMVRQQIHVHSYNADFSRTLFQLLVPNEFKDVARQFDQVVLVLDGYTANLPWELMVADERPLAVTTAVVRQLSSTTFRTGVRQATERRAYVIGNPSVEGYARVFDRSDAVKDPPSLPAAEREAVSAADVLGQYGFDVTRSIGDQEEAIDVITRLYKHPYRVLHIAAHGVFDQLHPDGKTRTGVVLSGGMLITAAEIGAMEVVPDLVFLNCCHLGQVSATPTEYNKLAYSVSRELIEMGVRCVVAAGWAVDDEAASVFADTFYRAMLGDNAMFGDAVYEARKAVFEQFPTSITWGAYQAYGDPIWRMEPRRDASDSKSSVDAWKPVAAEELIARIEQKRVQLRRMNHAPTLAEARAVAAQIDDMLRGRTASWLERLDVRAALGKLYADMGKEYFATAIDHYRRVVAGHDKSGRAPVEAIEQLANLEARAGEYSDDEAMIRKGINRLVALVTLVSPDALSEPSPDDVNNERRGLLGSGYKRLAAVHARRCLRASDAPTRTKEVRLMNDALDRSLHWYGGRLQDFTFEKEKIDLGKVEFRNAINRAFFEALLGEPGDAFSSAIEFARACGRMGVATGTLDGNYWNSVTRADAVLAEELLKGSFAAANNADQVEQVATCYSDARSGVLVGPKALDSTVQQICLLSLFHAARAHAMTSSNGAGGKQRAALRRTAESLQKLANQLLPGSCDWIPEPAGDTPAVEKTLDVPVDDVTIFEALETPPRRKTAKRPGARRRG